MNQNNLILKTDSYKLGHYNQYPKGTTGVYSYAEARIGGKYKELVFFGLQPLLRKLAGSVVTKEDVNDAWHLANAHFGNPDVFNYDGWMYIVEELDGKLPIRVKAMPEGSVVELGTAVFTIENTDPKCFWLTNALESFLLHVWYPSTVATLSRAVKQNLAGYLERTSDNPDAINFMLHDFGYRGATTDEAAAIGGLGHLVNFMGTDTLPALLLGINEYEANLETLGFSVVATEHSVMTALGAAGERSQVQRLLDDNPTGIISCVIDSYNPYKFVDMCGQVFKQKIMRRDGKFVFRPDSTTDRDPTPEAHVITLLEVIGRYFGTTTNSKGFRVLDPHVGILWGDGIDADGIEKILRLMEREGWAADNIVFGMGGGLLQKVNRDTQRWAVKSSAQRRNTEVWVPVQKNPLDTTKKSKAGRLKNIRTAGRVVTVREDQSDAQDLLQVVFEDGVLVREYTFDEVRALAA
jgi:nicotinamide phosphoribosyltransferase